MECDMPKVNLFASAKEIAPPPKPPKAEDKEVKHLPGLEDLATIDSLIKNLEAVKSSFEGEVKARMKAEFIAEGAENYRAVDGDAEASAECRKRSTNSALKSEEIALLAAADIPVGQVISQREAFIINPAYSEDPKYMKLFKQVSDKLQEIKDLPEDFILKQPEVSKTVVTDETFDAAMADKLKRKLYIDIVATLAIKPKLNHPNIEEMLDAVKPLLVPATA
jgi:hypothetical protein